MKNHIQCYDVMQWKYENEMWNHDQNNMALRQRSCFPFRKPPGLPVTISVITFSVRHNRQLSGKINERRRETRV